MKSSLWMMDSLRILTIIATSFKRIQLTINIIIKATVLRHWVSLHLEIICSPLHGNKIQFKKIIKNRWILKTCVTKITWTTPMIIFLKVESEIINTTLKRKSRINKDLITFSLLVKEMRLIRAEGSLPVSLIISIFKVNKKIFTFLPMSRLKIWKNSSQTLVTRRLLETLVFHSDLTYSNTLKLTILPGRKINILRKQLNI